MAATTVIHEKLSKSGTKKYFTPSRAPGLVTEYTVIKIASTTNIGIISLETRSTPRFTPANITKNTKSEKRINQNSTWAEEEIKSGK